MFMPMEEARLLEALKIQPSDSILEIGTGSGYMTALLAKLGKFVYSIDIFPDFCVEAQSKLTAHGISNVKIINADATQGWDQQVPYDVIVISGALEVLPENFRKSLKPGGRIFAIVGTSPAMEATVLTFHQKGDWLEDILFETVVPPLLNAPGTVALQVLKEYENKKLGFFNRCYRNEQCHSASLCCRFNGSVPPGGVC